MKHLKSLFSLNVSQSIYTALEIYWLTMINRLGITAIQVILQYKIKC